MNGWSGETTSELKMPKPSEAVTPAPATLSEVATSAQRWQLTNLIEALWANPDLAAQLHMALRRTP